MNSHLQHTLRRHPHGHLQSRTRLNVSQGSGTSSLDGRMSLADGWRLHAQVQTHLVERRGIKDSAAGGQYAGAEEAGASVTDILADLLLLGQLCLATLLQAPRVRERLGFVGNQTVGHGVLVRGLVVQGSQETGGSGKVPAADLEPA